MCRTPGPARSPVPTAAACDDSSRDKRSRLSRAQHVAPVHDKRCNAEKNSGFYYNLSERYSA